MLSSRPSLPCVPRPRPVSKRQSCLDNLEDPTRRPLSAENLRTTLTTKASSTSCCLPNPRTNSRRSNVVKEVERLSKNRQERRLRQAEKKEEKEALMNESPGNPNWYFLAMIKEYQAGLEFRPLQDTERVVSNQITVCVRKRPLSRREIIKKEIDIVSVPKKDLIILHEPKIKFDLTKYLENQHFRFDYAFDETCSNETVYKYTAKPLVKTIFDGGMATCFAYGQTGSGKTHTMGGTFTGKTQDCKKGIYAFVARDIFAMLNSPQHHNLAVAASFFEIYSGNVFDLLANKAKLRVLEDGNQHVQVWGLTQKFVNSVDEVLKLIQAGNQARTSGQTSANSNSSRSHAVFQITLRVIGSQKVHGKISLIDLAGNERGADTSSASKTTRIESAEINKSLLALKECIRALGRRGAYLPFRGSKLTQVLRDSFIGDNTKTCMIAMISPGMQSCEYSLNTLRYADRVKELSADECDPPQENLETDITALRSLKELEISPELFTFHRGVSDLRKSEEDMLDELISSRELTKRFLETEDQMIIRSQKLDCDQVLLSSDLINLINNHLESINRLRDKVLAFRQQVMEDEGLNKTMQPPNLY